MDTLEKLENKMKGIFDDIENKPITFFIKWAIIAWIVLWLIKQIKKMFED